MLVWFYRSLSIDDLRVLQFREKRGAVDGERVNDVKFAPIDLCKPQMLEAVGGHKQRPRDLDRQKSPPAGRERARQDGRNRLTSCCGGALNRRLHSRLNCEGLSSPTRKKRAARMHHHPDRNCITAGATIFRSDWNRTDLLQEGQQVRLPALFDNFSVGKAIEVHGLNLNLLSARRHAKEGRVVSTAHDETCGNRVVFRDHFFERPLNVGETRTHHAKDFHVPVRSNERIRTDGGVKDCIGINKLFGKHLVGCIDEFNKAGHQQFVRFSGHDLNPVSECSRPQRYRLRAPPNERRSRLR
jgi:hypothetical protein